MSKSPIAILPVPVEDLAAWCKEEGYAGYEDWMLLAERIGSSWMPDQGVEDLIDEICYRHETLAYLLVGGAIEVGELVPFTGPETVYLSIPACTCGNYHEITVDVHEETCLYHRVMMQICVYDVERGKHETKETAHDHKD